MYRHISLFTLENKEEIALMKEMLEEISRNDSTIQHSVVEEGMNHEVPIFADLIQEIDFNTLEDLEAYPRSSGHINLVQNGPKCKVCAIDYKMGE